MTPLGGLRKEGWMISMKFDENINGIKTLKTFKEYIDMLNQKFGNKAFGYFKKADYQ